MDDSQWLSFDAKKATEADLKQFEEFMFVWKAERDKQFHEAKLRGEEEREHLDGLRERLRDLKKKIKMQRNSNSALSEAHSKYQENSLGRRKHITSFEAVTQSKSEKLRREVDRLENEIRIGKLDLKIAREEDAEIRKKEEFAMGEGNLLIAELKTEIKETEKQLEDFVPKLENARVIGTKYKEIQKNRRIEYSELLAEEVVIRKKVKEVKLEMNSISDKISKKIIEKEFFDKSLSSLKNERNKMEFNWRIERQKIKAEMTAKQEVLETIDQAISKLGPEVERRKIQKKNGNKEGLIQSPLNAESMNNLLNNLSNKKAIQERKMKQAMFESKMLEISGKKEGLLRSMTDLQTEENRLKMIQWFAMLVCGKYEYSQTKERNCQSLTDEINVHDFVIGEASAPGLSILKLILSFLENDHQVSETLEKQVKDDNVVAKSVFLQGQETQE